MKLKRMKLKNFRAHKDTTINFNDLSVIMGKNDIGKSSILDALDLFFNSSNTKKVDKEDINVYSNESYVSITCMFELPENYEIILDTNVKTSLLEEHLLNKDNLFEIEKRFFPNKKIEIYIKCNHPNNFKSPLILLKINELKDLLKNLKIDDNNVNKTIKKDIRKFLFNTEKLEFEDLEIKIDDSGKEEKDSNVIYKKIENDFPMYMLFKSDRTNTDKDEEVSDSLKAITKVAVSELEEEFFKIKDMINQKIIEIANNTLEKLKEFEYGIANELKPDIDNKSLDSIFNFKFSCDDGISFNKRGSGVKRLMLLSFFLAESERQNTIKKNIIYAIEEPETSQHPDFQIKLIESFIRISEENNKQILLTTHTPEIIKLSPKDSIVFLKKDLNNNLIVDENIDIKEISETLGILPYVSEKGIIVVEGYIDKLFLENLNRIKELNEIVNLDDFTIIPLGGCGNVERWIKEDYFSNTNIKIMYFRDRDDKKENIKKNDFNKIVTLKREIENYIPIEVIRKKYNKALENINPKELGEIDIAKKIHESINNIKEEAIKSSLQAKELWKDVSINDLDNEVKDWFNRIKEFFYPEK